tara:strand:+ start:352 stop:750 length:399 start_codon:yes stop_codon:yes gene_type:complete
MTITKNKNKETIYSINKIDSLITFKGHDYNINDDATARNLIYMLMDKCVQDDNLIEDYKTIVKNQEQEHNECRKTNVKLRDIKKQYEKDMKIMDRDFSILLEAKERLEKDNTKIKNSIEMFFRLNENIIKEF